MSLWQKHAEHHISELFIRINSCSLLGDTTNMRLKQYQLDTNSAECILTSRNSTWKRSNCRNLGAKVLQLVKKLSFTISKNEDTESWNIIESNKRKDLLIENILVKANRRKSINKVSRLNI